MLYIVGDSNSVYTSRFLIGDVNRTLCKEGWTTDDVLNVLRRKGELSDASAFFVFVGLNDRLSGVGIASKVMEIVAGLRARRHSPKIPIILAPPFCVEEVTSTTLCNDRREAARRIVQEMHDPGLVLVSPHVKRDFMVKRSFVTHKLNSLKVDPLHLSDTGYKHVADMVNEWLTTHSTKRKRPKTPKIIYEGEPAPAPKVAWARARAAGRV